MAGLSRVPFSLLQTLTSSDLSAAFRLQGRDVLEALRYLAQDQPTVLGGLQVTGTAAGVSVVAGVLIAPYAAGASSSPQADESTTVLGLLRAQKAVSVPVLGANTWYTIEARPAEIDTTGTVDVFSELLGTTGPQTQITRREAGLELRARVGTTGAPPAAAPGWVPLADVLRRSTGGVIAPEDITDTRPLLSTIAVDRLAPGSEGDVLTTIGGGALWQPPAIPIDVVITPGAITADQSNYAPPSWSEATVVRLNPTVAGRTLRGLSASAVQKRKVLANVGTQTITLATLAGGQAAGNQIWTQGAGFALLSGAAVEVVYDATDAVWRVLVRDPFASVNTWPLGQIFNDTLALGGVSNELTYLPVPRPRRIVLDKPASVSNVLQQRAASANPFCWLSTATNGWMSWRFRLPHTALLQHVLVGVFNGQSTDVTAHAFLVEGQFDTPGINLTTDLGTLVGNYAAEGTIDLLIAAPATDGAVNTYGLEIDFDAVGQGVSGVAIEFADPGPRNH